MKNIIRAMVEKGYELGYISLINNPNDGKIAAQIGDYWFCFDSTEDRFMSVEEYETNTLFVDIVELIYVALTEMKTEFEDEYLYYFAYLFENLQDDMILNWCDLNIKFPEDRYDMSEEREREFVKNCFNLYEIEGFNNIFWTPWEDDENVNELVGQKIISVVRSSEERNDLCVFPLWDIKLESGEERTVYPEELIPSEMRKAGCPKMYLNDNEEDDEENNIVDIKKLCYELYKIDWKHSHGITYQMEMDEIKNYYSDFQNSVSNYTFDDYINDYGYAGMLYVCFDEFCENEYLDETYMCELLDDKNLIQIYYHNIGKEV